MTQAPDDVLALGNSYLETVSAARRKTDGIFYTPDHIVRYIVHRTLGGYLREHEAKLSQIGRAHV